MDNQTTPTKPNYYTIQGFDLWDITSRLPHPIASAVEYVYRHHRKNGVVDLEKARMWLQYAKETLEHGNMYRVAKANREIVRRGLQKLQEQTTTSEEFRMYSYLLIFLFGYPTLESKTNMLHHVLMSLEDLIAKESVADQEEEVTPCATK